MSCSNRTLVLAAFALAFSSTIVTAAHATTKTWVGGFSANDWFDGNNWSPIGVPATTDDVINNGTPNLTASATVNDYTQGGSLMGVGTLDVNGILTWNGGSMDGTGATNANGGLSMPGGNLKIIRRPLNCNSNATWSGGQMQMGSGGVLTIASGAVFDVQIDSEMQYLSGAPHIDNAGTFQKSAGTGTTVFRSSIAFNNTGVVDVQTGTLELDGGGTDTGTYNASGGTMMFAGGTRNLGASASITGGNMTFAGGTVNHAGSYSASTTAVTGGAVNFTGSPVSFTAVTLAGTLDLSTTDGPVNAATWVQSGGTLTGSSTLNVTGLLTWNGGSMDGTGTTNANGGLSMPSGSLKIIRRALNCNSNATWSGGQMQMGTGGVLTIASGTVFDIQVDTEMQFLGGAPHIDNAGTFQKSAGAGTTAFRSSIAFNNAGVVSVLAGTLELDSGGTDTGTYSAAGGTMMFAGGTRNLGASASMTGGNMTFAGGTVNHAGSYSASTTAVSGGTVNFTGSSVSFTDVTLNPGTLNLSTTGGPVSAATWVQSGGTLAGSSTLNVTGMLTWNGGPMDGTGTTNANGGLSMPTGLKIIRRALNSNSTATWSGGQMQMGIGGVLTIATGTVFDIQVDSEMQFLGGGPHIDNAGTFQKSAGTGTTAFRSSIAFNNTGLVSVQTGTLEFDANYTQTAGVTRLNGGALTVFGAFGFQGGNLEGSGTLTANVSNNGGVLSPGLSPGQLAITSGYAQGASSAYDVEIGGLTAGTQFDKTVISGAATLAGALNISLINGYQPNVGDTFQIMTFGSRTGDFTTVTGTTIGTGKFFQEIAGPTSITLVVVPALPTPTPTVTITPTPTATITPTGTATATPTTTVTPTPGPTTSATPTPIDHFTCYKAGATSGSVKFVGIGNPPGVSLQDSIETTQVALKKPKFLCAPTNALGQDPTAPVHPEHLTGYQIKGAAPGFTGSIEVVDMFNPSGTFVVAKKRSYLFVPTAKSLSATPPTPAAFATDHFECYKITLASGAPRFVAVPAVTLDDQLGPMTVLVKKPQYLCNPVNKNGEDPSASSHPAHLMCYQVKQTDAVKFVKHTALFVNNQFGPEELDAKKPSHLCVPATTP